MTRVPPSMLPLSSCTERSTKLEVLLVICKQRY